jgi:hypothetical protein
MNHLGSHFRGAFLTILFVSFTLVASAQTSKQSPVQPSPQIKQFRLVKAVVVDDRLSALRREADIQSPVSQRLRLGREVFIISTKNVSKDKNEFCRVAVTRRTRGWIHRAALASPTLAGEDARVMELIDTYKGLDKLTLCRLFLEQFRRSPLLAKAMLIMAQESDRAAASLNRGASRRLSAINSENARALRRDYYLSDPGLDRYSKLGIRFEFDEEAGKYFYEGEAYRDIIRLFPRSDEAGRARTRLEAISQKQARR